MNRRGFLSSLIATAVVVPVALKRPLPSKPETLSSKGFQPSPLNVDPFAHTHQLLIGGDHSHSMVSIIGGKPLGPFASLKEAYESVESGGIMLQTPFGYLVYRR